MPNPFTLALVMELRASKALRTMTYYSCVYTYIISTNKDAFCIGRKYHSDDDLSFGNLEGFPSDHQCNAHHCWLALPLHALDKPCVSSSWLSQIPSFRQETCQAYYRNDPVKYDLDLQWPLSDYVKITKFMYVTRKFSFF